MIEYLIGLNPDDRILKRAQLIMDDGGIIALPTDTHWVLAASPFSKKGLESLYRVKGVDRKKHLSLLCRDVSQASEYAVITNSIYRIIKRAIPGPFTFIFTPNKHLPKVIRCYEKDKEIGIRFPASKFCQIFLEKLPYPLITTSIIPMMLEGEDYFDADNENSHIYSYQIEDMFAHDLSMILDPGDLEIVGESTIIDFSVDETPRIIRQGAGDLKLIF